MTAPENIALIALDWGTTSFRVWALDAEGEVLAQSENGAGILAIREAGGADPAAAFEAAFEAAVAPWVSASAAPVLLSGMITSRNGWVETPYLPLPCDAQALASALVPHVTAQGRRLHFVTGAASQPEGPSPDVMRGEETELIGQIAKGDEDGLFILPGTHSKWVTVSEGRITAFRTVMTGEAFALFSRHSILGKLAVPGPFCAAAFRRGVIASGAQGPLLARLFPARSLVLFDHLAPEEVSDYLSGLLIGDEIRESLAGGREQKLTIIGRGDLAERYRLACDCLDQPATIAPEGMNRRGLFTIARLAGLIDGSPKP